MLDIKAAIRKKLESDLSEYQLCFLSERLIGFKEKSLLKKERSKATDLFEELIPKNDVQSLFLLHRNITSFQPYLIRLHYSRVPNRNARGETGQSLTALVQGKM